MIDVEAVKSALRATAILDAYGEQDHDVVGRLPGAVAHPTLGFVDALVMYQTL